MDVAGVWSVKLPAAAAADATATAAAAEDGALRLALRPTPRLHSAWMWSRIPPDSTQRLFPSRLIDIIIESNNGR